MTAVCSHINMSLSCDTLWTSSEGLSLVLQTKYGLSPKVEMSMNLISVKYSLVHR